MVAGLLEASEGELWIDGNRSEGTKDSNALSYMFQEDRVLPWRTAPANAEFGLEAVRPAIPARERHTRANAVLDLIGLQGSPMPTHTSYRAVCAAEGGESVRAGTRAGVSASPASLAVDAFAIASTNKIDRAVLKCEAAMQLADEGVLERPEGSRGADYQVISSSLIYLKSNDIV
jgi:ABC-type taurine transport system ATPase subunit